MHFGWGGAAPNRISSPASISNSIHKKKLKSIFVVKLVYQVSSSAGCHKRGSRASYMIIYIAVIWTERKNFITKHGFMSEVIIIIWRIPKCTFIVILYIHTIIVYTFLTDSSVGFIYYVISGGKSISC